MPDPLHCGHATRVNPTFAPPMGRVVRTTPSPSHLEHCFGFVPLFPPELRHFAYEHPVVIAEDYSPITGTAHYRLLDLHFYCLPLIQVL